MAKKSKNRTRRKDSKVQPRKPISNKFGLSFSNVIAVLGVLVAVIAVIVSVWIYDASKKEEIANLHHTMLIQPMGLQQDGTSEKWEVFLNVNNMGPAEIQHANTLIVFGSLNRHLVSAIEILEVPPLTQVEVKDNNLPVEAMISYKNLAPVSGFMIRMEFRLPSRVRENVYFKFGDEELVKSFIQLVGTKGENITVDYKSRSSYPIPNLDD